MELDPKLAHPWNGLGLLYQDRFGKCRKALDHFTRGMELEPKDPYLLMNRGHLRMRRGDAWRSDLEAALEGFVKEKNLFGVINNIKLAVTLGQPKRLPGEDALAAAKIRRDKSPYLHADLALMALDRAEDPGSSLNRIIERLTNYSDWMGVVNIFHLIAGARPDLREQARQAAKQLFNLPAERIAQLKGVPKPEQMARYRPFVEGQTDGAGDPRELALFCPNT